MIRILAAAIFALAGVISDASLAAQAPPASAKATSTLPLTYALGHTTITEIKKYLAASGGKITSTGQVNFNPGELLPSSHPKHDVRVEILNASGIDFENFPAANFVFLDKTLFRVEVPLRRIVGGQAFMHYTETQFKDLETALRTKYGPPADMQHDPRNPISKELDTLIWKRDGNTIRLAKYESIIVYANDQMEADVAAYSKKEQCKDRDPKTTPYCQ